MEVRELRIGNKLFKDGVVVSIDARSIFDMWENDPEEFGYKPIQLTADWMLKLGAEYKPCGISGADMWQGMGFWTIKDKAETPIPFRGAKNCKGGLTLYPYFNTNFNTVHGFQNIIKDLTGENL